MNDENLAATLEQTILAHRPLKIAASWADEIVFPYYDGLSIRNLAHTVVQWLVDRHEHNDSQIGPAPLKAPLWQHWRGQVRRVVLFITDGLGWQLLQELAAQDAAIAQILADLTGEGMLVPITSITPSTTAAALPCIWTGASPAATGMVGTQFFLREFGVLANLLHYTPVNGKHRSEALEDWGLNFDNFLPRQTLGQVLASWGVETYLLQQKGLLGTGLSRLMHRGIAHERLYFGYTDLWVALRELLHETRRKRCFVSAYWNAVDSLSHLHGRDAEHTTTEIRRQLADLRDVLGAQGVRDGHTLFMLVADHGHTPITDYVVAEEHPPLLDALRMAPAGDARLAHLYLRHGTREAVIAYLRENLEHKLACVLPEEALAAGLFGTEPPTPEAAPRLGDLTLIAREGVALSMRAPNGNASRSRHAGMSAREMLVPLLLRTL